LPWSAILHALGDSSQWPVRLVTDIHNHEPEMTASGDALQTKRLLSAEQLSLIEDLKKAGSQPKTIIIDKYFLTSTLFRKMYIMRSN
jgi:hypothetical protein